MDQLRRRRGRQSISMYEWAKPSRSPIFDNICAEPLGLYRRAGLQHHDRPTVARRYFHHTRLGNRCKRWSLRALQRACARSCSISPSTRCYQLTIMGGAAYPRACPPEISEAAALLMGGQPASQRRRGARQWYGPDVQRVWLAAGTRDTPQRYESLQYLTQML